MNCRMFRWAALAEVLIALLVVAVLALASGCEVRDDVTCGDLQLRTGFIGAFCVIFGFILGFERGRPRL